MTTLKDILKGLGLFGNDIRQRVSNSQVEVGGEVVKDLNQEFDVVFNEDQTVDFKHIGCALCDAMASNPQVRKEVNLLAICGVSADCLCLPEFSHLEVSKFLNEKYIFVRASKRELFLVKRNSP